MVRCRCSVIDLGIVLFLMHCNLMGKLLVPRQVSQGSADSDATIWVQVLMPCDHVIALPTAAHATTLGSLGRMPPTSAALVKSLPSSDDGEYATA